MKNRYCEICHGFMGVMSDEAYDATHNHCDKPECELGCIACDDERMMEESREEDYADERGMGSDYYNEVMFGE